MSRLVAIDPDTKACGVALFVDGRLRRALALPVSDFAAIAPLRAEQGDSLCVIERPRMYGRVGDQRDFLDLAVIVGRAQEIMRAQGYEVQLVEPRVWKGGAPKRITSLRVWARLSAQERCRVDLPARALRALDAGQGVASGRSSDVLDAVGIGLWALGRTTAPEAPCRATPYK